MGGVAHVAPSMSSGMCAENFQLCGSLHNM